MLGDYTTFKVVVQNADVIENGTDVIDKKPNVIVNVTENGTNNNGVDTNSGTNENTDGTNNDTNGTMRNDKRNDGTINGTIAEQSGTMKNQLTTSKM